MNHKLIAYFLILATTLTSTACTTLMDGPICQSLDWHKLGVNLGSKGANQEDLAKYSSRCNDHDVSGNDLAYQEGYQEGLEFYCQPPNIYKIAQSSREDRYKSLCPETWLEDLNYAYSLGQEYRSRRSSLSSLESEASKIYSEKSSIEDEIRGLEKYGKSINEEESYKGAKEVNNASISSLERKVSELRSAYNEIERDIEDTKKDLKLLESEHLSLLDEMLRENWAKE